MITREHLAELLSYDPETGHFKWRVGGIKRKPGAVAGSHHKRTGYVYVGVAGRKFLAHRLAWLFVYGDWPACFTDHINGIKTDNRICNLRQASFAVNSQNQRKPRQDNTIGLLGVVKHGSSYRAQLQVECKTIRRGRFETPEAAHVAYVELKRQYHEGCTL